MVVIGSNTRFSPRNGNGKGKTKAPGPFSDKPSNASAAAPNPPAKKARRKFRWVKDADGFEMKVPIAEDDDIVSPVDSPEASDWAEDVADHEAAAASTAEAAETVRPKENDEIEIEWDVYPTSAVIGKQA